MKLSEILKGCRYTAASAESSVLLDSDISGIAYDSRKVEKGFLFVALKGEKHDGHNFIAGAVTRGAAAIAAEMPYPQATVIVEDGRASLACVSANFYGRPSEKISLLGITGTNGKTTTSYILRSILASWRKRPGVIGTIKYLIDTRSCVAPHTTPEAVEFQQLLEEMRRSGCDYVISEVSSHALAQRRVDGSVFRGAVFTNLTRDHLDFHPDMDSYFDAKARLFTELLAKNGSAAVNYDDAYGRKLSMLLTETRPDIQILTYGIRDGADIIAKDVRMSFSGSNFTLCIQGRCCTVSSPLTGLTNVYNSISAVSLAVSLGIPLPTIIDGVRNTRTVEGRFERVDVGQNYLCVIDYAHTEDALERLITTARELLSSRLFPFSDDVPRNSVEEGKGRIITVFGCGGDRDRGKRPRMGEVATRLSDFTVITSDNPRSEEPGDIIDDILEGVRQTDYLVEPDRKKAIEEAVAMAGEGDIILIAGKGHEDYQEIMGERFHFSDREIAAAAMKQAEPGKARRTNDR